MTSLCVGTQQVVFFMKISDFYSDSFSFRKLTRKQDLLRNFMLFASYAFFAVFTYYSTTQGPHSASSTMKAIGVGGYLSLAIRIVYNLQICSLFTADAILFMLRKAQKSQDLGEDNIKYTKALGEFTVLVTPDDTSAARRKKYSGRENGSLQRMLTGLGKEDHSTAPPSPS